MKDKISIISKIIVSAIFITLILLILGNSVKAKVDGYYTHSDVRLVVGNYIEVNGKNIIVETMDGHLVIVFYVSQLVIQQPNHGDGWLHLHLIMH